MRSLFLIAAALGLAACQPGVVVPATLPSAPVATANDLCSGYSLTAGVIADEKTLYAAEAAYNVAAHAYVTADGNRQLSPALKARVKPLLQRAYVGLKLLRGAYAVGDARGFNCQYGAVYSFVNQAKALLPAAK